MKRGGVRVARSCAAGAFRLLKEDRPWAVSDAFLRRGEPSPTKVRGGGGKNTVTENLDMGQDKGQGTEGAGWRRGHTLWGGATATAQESRGPCRIFLRRKVVLGVGPRPPREEGEEGRGEKV